MFSLTSPPELSTRVKPGTYRSTSVVLRGAARWMSCGRERGDRDAGVEIHAGRLGAGDDQCLELQWIPLKGEVLVDALVSGDGDAGRVGPKSHHSRPDHLGAHGHSREHIRAGRAGLRPHRRPPDRHLSSGDGCALLVTSLSRQRTGLRGALPDRGGEGDQKQRYDKGLNTIQDLHSGILQLLGGAAYARRKGGVQSCVAGGVKGMGGNTGSTRGSDGKSFSARRRSRRDCRRTR